MKNLRTLTVGLITLAATSTLAGCLVSATPLPAARPVAYGTVTYNQEPIYHDGYVVQFDTAGFPFIYVGRTPRYVPHDHPRFPYLMQRSPRHWRSPGYARIPTSYGGATVGHGRDGRYDRDGRHDRDGGYGRGGYGRGPRGGRYD